MQQQLDNAMQAEQQKFARTQEDLKTKSEMKTKEDIYRSQADRAVGMQTPDVSGLSLGVSTPPKKVIEEPFGFQPGFSLAPSKTASEAVLKIGKQ